MKTVSIHGQKVNYESVKSDIEYANQQIWKQVKWTPSKALIDKKSGSVRTYVGQQFNPDDFELSNTAWTHDHCLICNERIDDETVELVYTDGCNWLCNECFNQFIT